MKIRVAIGPFLSLAVAGVVMAASPSTSTKPEFPPLPNIQKARVVASEFLYDHAPFPSCHASTIVEAADGTLVAAFFGGTAERNPDVCIWVTRQINGKWTPVANVADGVTAGGAEEAVRLPTWNPVLFQPKGGPLQLYYKVGPKPAGWWGMVVSSADSGTTWSKPTRLPAGCLGPVKDKAVQLPDGVILSPSSVEGSGGWRVHVERSTDGGATWCGTVPGLIAPRRFSRRCYCIRAGQHPVFADAGGCACESWSRDEGKTWSALKATSCRIRIRAWIR